MPKPQLLHGEQGGRVKRDESPAPELASLLEPGAYTTVLRLLGRAPPYRHLAPDACQQNSRGMCAQLLWDRILL